MSVVREPVAAGRFYPADPARLAAAIARLLTDARPHPPIESLRGLVVPHAAYRYSGAVAASAFALLPRPEQTLRVALLGPSHFVAVAGAAVSGALAWRTPLGIVTVDRGLRDAAVAAGAAVGDAPHRDDHALEVELPFLQQRAGKRLRILPLAVGGDATPVLAALAPEALVVVSTDLSHYHDDATARSLDRRTADAVVALDPDAIGDLDACGADALRSLVRHARDRRWHCTLLDLRTSADASHDLRHVVGYGAFALTAVSRATTSDDGNS